MGMPGIMPWQGLVTTLKLKAGKLFVHLREKLCPRPGAASLTLRANTLQLVTELATCVQGCGMDTSLRKPVLIAGAGLSSLLLAQCLRRASIPFQIYERDASISFRAQGYRLRLSSEGLDAIESSLSQEDWTRFWNICSKTGGAGLVALDAISGEARTVLPKVEEGQTTKSRPEFRTENIISRDGKTVGIARGDMRKLFMAGCEGFVHWSHKVTGYQLTPTGVHAVFADGTKSVEGEMLIAGDGIYSKVAQQLSKGALKTYDTGARGIHGQAPRAAFKGLGEGVWRIIDDVRSDGQVFVITNVRPDDMDRPDVLFGWTMGAKPGVVSAPNNDYSLIGAPAAKMAKSLTANWHPRFKPLFDQMVEHDAAFWKITCSTPTGVPDWKNESRVTVIGDAVHSMTPAGGIGANTACRDSALLGRLITEAGGFKEGVTAAYEKEMRVYASEAVAFSYGLATGAFGIAIDANSKTVTEH